jgi:hypothetical protein
MTSKVMAVALCLAAAPASAQGDLKTAPVRLSLQIVSDKPGERCARSDASDPAPLVTVSLHWTFHDDFDEHPLLNGRWVSHYAGAGSRPESLYAGGEGSVLSRKTNTTANSRSMWIPVTKGEGWSRSVSTRSRFEMACCRLSRAGYLPISRRCCSA